MKQERLARRAARHDWFLVAPGLWGLRDVMVNIYMIHNPADNSWVLVDAGLAWSAPKIRRMAEQLFWPDVRPSAIVLTHAHFDHVGSLKKLAQEWEVPVYAHRMEAPYLTGRASYPDPDPWVGGGIMPLFAFAYPTKSEDVSGRLQLLPEDGTIPVLPEWRYIHTPGHSPGHISLFRERDKVLVAGDAFVTTRQESAVAIALQTRIVSGPPKYFTYDWKAAAESVRRLAVLRPEIVATGHGRPMEGEEMRRKLDQLVKQFRKLAVPRYGRYVNDPARVDENGVVVYAPKPEGPSVVQLASLVAFTAGLAAAAFIISRRNKRNFVKT